MRPYTMKHGHIIIDIFLTLIQSGMLMTSAEKMDLGMKVIFGLPLFIYWIIKIIKLLKK